MFYHFYATEMKHEGSVCLRFCHNGSLQVCFEAMHHPMRNCENNAVMSLSITAVTSHENCFLLSDLNAAVYRHLAA